MWNLCRGCPKGTIPVRGGARGNWERVGARRRLGGEIGVVGARRITCPPDRVPAPRLPKTNGGWLRKEGGLAPGPHHSTRPPGQRRAPTASRHPFLIASPSSSSAMMLVKRRCQVSTASITESRSALCGKRLLTSRTNSCMASSSSPVSSTSRNI
jgi:hypothetical protein